MSDPDLHPESPSAWWALLTITLGVIAGWVFIWWVLR